MLSYPLNNQKNEKNPKNLYFLDRGGPLVINSNLKIKN